MEPPLSLGRIERAADGVFAHPEPELHRCRNIRLRWSCAKATNEFAACHEDDIAGGHSKRGKPGQTLASPLLSFSMSRSLVVVAIVIALTSQVWGQSTGTVGPSTQNQASAKDLKHAQKMAEQVEKRFHPNKSETTGWATGPSESSHHGTR